MTELSSTASSDPRRVKTETLVIGCGNLLRGDDGAGPLLIDRLSRQDLPAQVQCLDAGIRGLDVAYQMRGIRHVILVDACQTEQEPGTIFELTGDEVEQLPSVQGLNVHSFRWNHALALGRSLLKDEYPSAVSVYLIEGKGFGLGAALSAPVDDAIDRLVIRLLNLLRPETAAQFTPETGLVQRAPAIRYIQS